MGYMELVAYTKSQETSYVRFSSGFLYENHYSYYHTLRASSSNVFPSRSLAVL